MIVTNLPRVWFQYTGDKYFVHLCSYFVLSACFTFLHLWLDLNLSLSVGTSRKGKGWFKWQEFLSCPSHRHTRSHKHTLSVHTPKHTWSNGSSQHIHIVVSLCSLQERTLLCLRDLLLFVYSPTEHRKPSDYVWLWTVVPSHLLTRS